MEEIIADVLNEIEDLTTPACTCSIRVVLERGHNAKEIDTYD